MKQVVIVGCGLSGIVAGRYLADKGIRVDIFERRSHIAGNIYDYVDSNGVLVQKYGPHSFFTDSADVINYVKRFVQVSDSFVECLTCIDGSFYPMPFNFRSIDLMYDRAEAESLKNLLKQEFKNLEFVSITDLIDSKVEAISNYGRVLFDKEYRLYTAKQWGRPIESILPEVFKRVPVYLSYRRPYQRHTYQFLPEGGFTNFASLVLRHPNITVHLDCDALRKLSFGDETINIDGFHPGTPILFTGAIDELFGFRYGELPYRSLEFIWKTLQTSSFQPVPIVAYPQAEKVTRITEYTKLPKQCVGNKTVISCEVPFEYNRLSPFGNEPYYPVLTEQSKILYSQYIKLSRKYHNLFLSGRLADFKYYNMDHVILRSQEVGEQLFASISANLE